MTADDTPRLAALLRRLCAAYGRPYSPELLEAHVVVLSGEQVTDVERRGIAWLATQRWFPAPVDLLRGPRRDAKDLASAAWARVRGRIAAVAANRDDGVVEDAAASDALSRLGGWHRLGQLESDALDRRRQDFLAAYVEAADAIEAEFAAGLAEQIEQGAASPPASAIQAAVVVPAVDQRIGTRPRAERAAS